MAIQLGFTQELQLNLETAQLHLQLTLTTTTHTLVSLRNTPMESKESEQEILITLKEKTNGERDSLLAKDQFCTYSTIETTYLSDLTF